MLYRLLALATLFGWLVSPLDQAKNLETCLLSGQQFPAPARLISEDGFHKATQAVEQIIHKNLTASPYNETTFSIGMFSTSDDGLVYEYHHTDHAVATSKEGTKRVDADSIYRIASISKVLIVYMWLLSSGDRHWNDPLTDYIPELAHVDQSQQEYIRPDWNEITISDLAMFLAGAARDYGLNDAAIPSFVTSGISDKMAVKKLIDNPESGLNVPASEDPVCGYFVPNVSYLPCEREQQYLHGVSMLGASFAPGLTPSYSNANFALLGIALSRMTGKSIDAVLDSTLVKPLGLTGTTSGKPLSVTNRSVVASGKDKASGWHNDLGVLNAAAGGYSTTNDLASIGRSILNHTLLSKAVTNRWFSTIAFVDRLDQAVGRGWEVFRKQVGGHTVDIFTKSGNWGGYRSVLALIPDYGFGFSILTASSHGHLDEILTNLIGNKILPALESVARKQAAAYFAGHYASWSSNSSITITTDSRPGLRLTQYIVHGIDLIKDVFEDFGHNIDYRLVPSQLSTGNHVTFSGLYQPPEPPFPKEEWYWPCQAWLDIDDFTYGSVPMGQMTFEVDGKGRAVNVRLNAFRETLMRKDDRR